MICRICNSSLHANQNGPECSEACTIGLRLSQVREEALASERRFAQCQVCFKSYSAANGDVQFCSVRCRDALWGSFVA